MILGREGLLCANGIKLSENRKTRLLVCFQRGKTKSLINKDTLTIAG